MTDRNNSKRTIVLGASPNPGRYSYRAVISLIQHGHETIPVGIKEGQIGTEYIRTGPPDLENVDTVTLYLNSENQKKWYEFLMALKPKRIIFNPGAENPELEAMAKGNGIHTENACTLVLLSIGNY